MNNNDNAPRLHEPYSCVNHYNISITFGSIHMRNYIFKNLRESMLLWGWCVGSYRSRASTALDGRR